MTLTKILTLERTDARFGRPCDAGHSISPERRARYLAVSMSRAGSRRREALCHGCALARSVKTGVPMPETAGTGA